MLDVFPVAQRAHMSSKLIFNSEVSRMNILHIILLMFLMPYVGVGVKVKCYVMVSVWCECCVRMLCE